MFKGQKGKELVKDTLDKEKVPYMVVDNGGELLLLLFQHKGQSVFNSYRTEIGRSSIKRGNFYKDSE